MCVAYAVVLYMWVGGVCVCVHVRCAVCVCALYGCVFCMRVIGVSIRALCVRACV